MRAPAGIRAIDGDVVNRVACGDARRALRDDRDPESCFREITRQLARVRLDATHKWMVEGAQEKYSRRQPHGTRLLSSKFCSRICAHLGIPTHPRSSHFRMTRIAVVTSSPPMVEGGHMVIARELTRALRDAGHDAHIVVTPQNRFGRQASAYLATWLTDVDVERRPADRPGDQPAVSELRRPPSAVTCAG